MHDPVWRRSRAGLGPVLSLAVVALLLVAPTVVSGQGSGATATLTGTVTTDEPAAFSSSAVAVVTIVDRSARGGEGTILGQQRGADPGSAPFRFEVPYDASAIVEDHAYAVFAAVVDGDTEWQNRDGVPVITGGPTTDVAVAVERVATAPGTISGQITKSDEEAQSKKAVALAAALDRTSGRMVAWTAISPTGEVPIDFRLGFDPATLDPEAGVGMWAAIVDGTAVWESGGTQPLAEADTDASAGVITVSRSGSLPVPPPPTPAPTAATVIVPAVVGLPEDDAVATLASDDLGVDETKRKHHDNVAAGDAIKTDPAAGTSVPVGSTVDLFVSTGPDPEPSPTPATVTVPDVRGLPEDDAAATLESGGLVIDETKRKHHDNVAAGDAIKTDPAAGTTVAEGSRVDLYVSTGPSPSPTPTLAPTPKPTPVVVPEVRDLPEAVAVDVLEDDDLDVADTIRKHHQNVDAGDAIKTDPESGSKVPPGSDVDLYVSTGPTPSPSPKPVAVPDVRGLPEADAIIEIGDAGLVVGDRIRRTHDTIEAGSAIRTDPEAGTKVPPRTVVDLYVSSGLPVAPTPTPSPTPSPSPSPLASPAPSASPGITYPTTGIGYLSGVLLYRNASPPTADRAVILRLFESGAFGLREVPSTPYVEPSATSPQGFVIAFDWAEIDPTASYRVLAAIVDGPNVWSSRGGTPAITAGAMISGLVVPLAYRSDVLEGEVTGVITGVPEGLSPAALREVFVIAADTGAVVGYDAAPVTGPRSLAFSVPYLIDEIDPTVPYLAQARVTDGPSLWTGASVPVITLGAPHRVVLQVTSVGAGAPTATPTAMPATSATPVAASATP